MSHWIERKQGKPSRWRSGLVPVCGGLFACAALIAPIGMPRELSEHVRLELSGAVWSQPLLRYVLVSDDVNEDGAKHLPQLFTLSQDGKMDPAPITIDGIDELNDPESITAGPDGTLFVSTSHSLNKKGHCPVSRRRLLQIRVGPDRKAKILGEIDLTTARDAAGSPPWGADARLDIEAIAFRDGALLIGLKSPLGADGSATIVRLPEVAAVMKSGVIPLGAVKVWAHPRFCVVHGTAYVCEGVADLAFLPDGSLLVAANSPKGMPSDGGGSLWKLDNATSAPTLLKRFDALKPEGVALAPDHASAIIVFDTDGQKPLWVRWPLTP
jgi:hypothetical protein